MRDAVDRSLVGVLEVHAPWAVRLTTRDGLRVVSFEEMIVAERHAGRRPAVQAFARGALRGLAVGAVVGTAATLLAVRQERRDDCTTCMITGTMFVGAMSVAFTIVTTGVGGSVGLRRRDRWERIWPPAR